MLKVPNEANLKRLELAKQAADDLKFDFKIDVVAANGTVSPDMNIDDVKDLEVDIKVPAKPPRETPQVLPPPQLPAPKAAAP